jgi:hypothetical protein
MDKLIKHHNIINHIKAPKTQLVRPCTKNARFQNFKIFNWTPLIARSKGRPKQRWKDNIIQGIRQMNIKNWAAYVQDRVKWINVVDKAKTFK